jgi:hypothetical protein
MIDAAAFIRNAEMLAVLVLTGLLWPLRYIWLFPVTIILLGVAAVSL